MSATYKAIQVTKPGEFAAVTKPLVDPGPGYVRIRVEACGVCHLDAATVEGLFPIAWPPFGGGAVNQNNVFLFIESMPYGGVGTSGIGTYYGRYGYDSFTHAKSVLISPPDVAIDHLFPPYTKG